MCIVTNLKYIITVCYDGIILYNFLPMHSSFFQLVQINVNPRMRPPYLRRWPNLTEVLKGKYD